MGGAAGFLGPGYNGIEPGGRSGGPGEVISKEAGMIRQLAALAALAVAAGAYAQEVDGRAKAQLLRKPYVSTGR